MVTKEWLTTSESIDYIHTKCPYLYSNYFAKFNSASYHLLMRMRKEKLFGVETKKGYTHGRVEAVFFNKQSLDRANDMFYYREHTKQIKEAHNKAIALEDEINYVAQSLQEMQEKLDSLIALSEEQTYKKELASAKRKATKQFSHFPQGYTEVLEHMLKTTIHQKPYGVRL